MSRQAIKNPITNNKHNNFICLKLTVIYEFLQKYNVRNSYNSIEIDKDKTLIRPTDFD